VMSHLDYYEQKEIWETSKLEPYQKQVLVDILDMLPLQVESILDVGCGSGIITNELPEHISAFGLDLSFAALRQVQQPKCMGSIISIPFPDNTFDLVLTSDVLEHLNDQELSCALLELQRVSKKFVLVTVPLNEQLQTNFAKCGECGCVYHVNYHQRSFSEKSILNLFENFLVPVEVRLSGSITRPCSGGAIALRHKFGKYFSWSGAVCPQCCSKKQVFSEESDLFDKALTIMEGKYWETMFDSNFGFNDRSEIIALFSNKREHSPPVEALVNPGLQTLNRYIVDFSNSLHYAENGFTAQNNVASFTLEDVSCLTAQGVCHRNNGSPARVHFKTPFRVQRNDRVAIRFDGSGEGNFSLYVTSSVFNTQVCVVSRKINRGETVVTGEIVEDTLPDEFGRAWDLYLEGDLCVQSIDFLINDGDGDCPFLLLHEGLNVYSLYQNGVKLSWGLYLDKCGKYPLPNIKDFFLNDSKAASYPHEERLVETLEMIYQKWDLLKSALIGELEVKENLRHASEKAYRQLSENKNLLELENRQLNENLQLITLHRDSLTGIKGSCKELLRNMKRLVIKMLFGASVVVPPVVFPEKWQMLKQISAQGKEKLPILIVSHMFPHPEQEGLGSFVYEQVRHLREHHKIDARVLVGRPFWSHIYKHPLAVLRWNSSFYKRACVLSRWYDLEGVPVMYVPYRVLPRLFFGHGRAYMRSITRKAIEIHKKFPFEIVHAHTSFLDGSAGRLISKKLHIPFIITEHTGPFSLLTKHPVVRYFTRKALISSKKVILVSRSLKEEVDDCIGKSQADKSVILANGVDIGTFTPGHQDLDAIPIRLIYIGALDDNKNVALLFRAFSKLKGHYHDIMLTLVGDDAQSDYKMYLDSIVEDNQLVDCVKFVGQKCRKECAELLSSSHILIVPSRSETFSCVVIEAFSCGKPVVATRCGGPESLITHDYLGELCLNDDVDDMVRCLRNVIDRIDGFEPAQIRQYAVENFSYESITKDLVGIYRELVPK